ncbi:unnamed protein product [Orchesella dallaii]|uniref:Protein kinase domain-containing protein n=1 Tax=Orchesella dallaii TaxID=48710 RepID=A0ABP1R6A7_9HEXA
MNIKAAVIYIILFGFIRQATCQLGIVYSPFVKPGDRPESTRSYNVQDLKIMLELIAEQKFNHIATYGMGAPNEQYKCNSTIRRCASIANTALAAAEINKAKNKTILSVYQGVFPATSEQTLNSEIKVAFEIAAIANLQYERTVAGIIFPSIASFDSLYGLRPRLEINSHRARAQNLEFGVRLWDCADKILGLDPNDQATKELIGLFDFIICQTLPTTHDFRNGPLNYVSRITERFVGIENALNQVSLDNQHKTKVILESGWPSGEDLGVENTVEKMNQFWEALKLWADNGKKRSIFLHEAFNNPWKEVGMTDVVWANHYGRWIHNGGYNNSRSAYVFKEPHETENDSVNAESPNNLHMELIIGLLSVTVILFLIGVIFAWLYRTYLSGRREKLNEDEIQQFRDGIVSMESSDEEDKDNHWKWLPYDMSFELAKHSFSIDKTSPLGNGQFGCVYKGHIAGSAGNVAFKMSKAGPNYLPGVRSLLFEIKILTYLGKHENVIEVCGAYTTELENGIVYMAIELCVNGSLEKFLRKRNTCDYANLSSLPAAPGNDYVNNIRFAPLSTPEIITDSQLLAWSFQIASAMEFISSKHVIHADIAARNILLTSDLTAKVTDFGLSRRLYQFTEYVKTKQEPLPWKWMAVESLKRNEFSTKSDVWSYGVTLWEIFSNGDIPYSGRSWDVTFATQLETGLRLASPSRASSDMYDVMKSCWELNPTLRPTFGAIRNKLVHANV